MEEDDRKMKQEFLFLDILKEFCLAESGLVINVAPKNWRQGCPGLVFYRENFFHFYGAKSCSVNKNIIHSENTSWSFQKIFNEVQDKSRCVISHHEKKSVVHGYRSYGHSPSTGNDWWPGRVEHENRDVNERTVAVDRIQVQENIYHIIRCGALPWAIERAKFGTGIHHAL